jgi:hypothetical protein
MNSSTSSFKALVIGTLPYFLVALAGLYGIREVMYLGIRSNEVGEFAKLRTLYLEKNDYDLVFIGSSRCESHIRPPVIDSAIGTRSYNIGTMGSGFPLQLSILKSYLVHSKVPKYAVISVDYYAPHRSDRLNNFVRYFPYFSNRTLYKELVLFEQRMIAFRCFAPYALAYLNDRYRYAATRGFTGRTIDFDLTFENGFVPVPIDHPEVFREEIVPFDVSAIDSGMADLQALVDYCLERDIAPIIVASPTHFELTKDIQNRSQAVSAIQELSDRNHVPFFNYIDLPMSKNQSLFADRTHLNFAGATAFSRVLAEDLKDYIEGL